ncbi:alternative ribosome rescue aminoacyl-tRNA hydrolase ArfB [Flavobacteriaceae bacterium]|jgi:ribosome-associated protein|nr:alternative ribosome rescue aminoacyl-tRNA hydrolase ArfB [Flavobacteriaceae bacterium]MDB2419800.1 alternative ribosome rescue aminoacyl-tRNA hydrolase ArfB [Flavobacteriaceae bacterium]
MDKETIYKELHFKAVRSSGAGGQHVNKVSSKVELYFDLASSEAFTEKAKQLLLKNLSNRINKEGVLKIYSSESRSQHTNKEKVVKRLFKIIEKGLIVPKKRRPTKMSRAQKIKRLDNKTKHATKKILRKKPTLE